MAGIGIPTNLSVGQLITTEDGLMMNTTDGSGFLIMNGALPGLNGDMTTTISDGLRFLLMPVSISELESVSHSDGIHMLHGGIL